MTGSAGALAVLEATEVASFVPVALAGSRPGSLHDALAEANDRGRRHAERTLARDLPDTPHDDRRRTEVVPVIGRVGDDLARRITADRVLDALDGLDAGSGRVTLHVRGPERAERLPVEQFLLPRRVPDAPGVLDLGRVMGRLDEDVSLQVHHLDRVDPDLAALAEAVERATGTAVSINALVAGGATVGLGRHSDIWEMWIVHLEGRKGWTLWEPSIPWFDHRRPAPGFGPGNEALRVEMVPGRTLVVPRGHLHRVEPSGTLTVALSIILEAPSRVELLESHLAGVGGQAAWLEPVHAAGGRASAPAADGVGDDLEGILRGEVARARSRIPGRPLGGSTALVRAVSSGDGHGLAFRSALGGGVHVVEDIHGEGSVVVAGGGRVVRIRRDCTPLLPCVLSGLPFTLDDLGGPAGRDLAVRLVADLVHHGLLTVAVGAGPDPQAI